MKLKEILKFLSGFQTAHLLGHIYLQLVGMFPQVYDFKIFTITVTSTLNLVAIAYNFVILLVLLYFAYRRK